MMTGTNDGLALSTDLASSKKNDSISCELGIQYPTLQSIMSGRKRILSIQVSHRQCMFFACYRLRNITYYITFYIQHVI